jgi:hypothetical protein
MHTVNIQQLSMHHKYAYRKYPTIKYASSVRSHVCVSLRHGHYYPFSEFFVMKKRFMGERMHMSYVE